MTGSLLTRRTFLKGTGLGLLGAFMAACGGQPATTSTQAPTSNAPPATAPASSSGGTSQQPTAAPAAQATTAPAAQGAASGGKSVSGEFVWLVRADTVENKGQEQIFMPMLKEKLPGVKVNRVVVPQSPPGNYNAKILTLAAAKQGLDLWGFGQNYMDFWARGMPQNLNSYIAADKWDVDNYFLPGLASIYKVHGNHYGLPQLTCYGSNLVYNKKMFEEAGLDTPPVSWDDKSWTMDKLREYAKKLSKNSGTPDATYGVNIGLQRQTDLSFLWGDSSWLPEHYTNFIAPKSNFGNPGNIAGHQFIHDLMYKDKSHPDPAAAQGLSQLGDAFHTGRVGMSITGGWQYWTDRDITAFKVGYAAIPYGKADKIVNYDDQWIMARWSSAKDAVWAAMRVLTSVEATTKYSELSGTPPTPRDSTDPWLKKLSDFTGQSVDDLKKVTLGAIQTERTQESPDHLFIQWPKISTTYTNKIAALWNNGDTTAEKEWPAIVKEIDQVVGEIYNQFKDSMPKD